MLFNNLFKKEQKLETFNLSDEDIVAITDAELFDVKEVKDPVFSEKMLGDSVAFKINENKATLCSPANGELSVMFPTGHAYGITTKKGVEILVHVGIDTVNSKGNGFKVLKKQDDEVKAGEPIVEVNYKLLKENYDMSTILIITNNNGQEINFKEAGFYHRGDLIIK